MNAVAAADYAERHGLEALRVERDGVAVERYANGFDADKPHALYSGTKSFWGPLAVALQDDGALDLDDPVGATFPAWSIGSKARVRLRDLLTLTSGIGFGGLGNAVPEYERALTVELKNEPRTTFTYGGIPLQIFGAVLAHKLGRSPHDVLAERILAPAHVGIARWRSLADGTKPLPTGAFTSVAAWAAYGRFVLAGGKAGGRAIVAESSLARCFEGTAVNPRYGLGWWLADEKLGTRVVYASGAGGQALYVLPSERTIVVKFGRSASYRHETFLRRLLSS